jgi:hypothetical protein
MVDDLAAEGVLAYRRAAVEFAIAQNWPLTPLQGKVPILKAWTRQPPAAPEMVRRWAVEYNLGLRTGTISRIVVVDQDRGGNVASLDLPETLCVETGSGGIHYYFAIPEDLSLGNTAGKLGPKIDTRGDGGQVVYPGSIHPETGRMYRWANASNPEQLPIADLPMHIVEVLRPKPKPPLDPVSRRATTGSRYARAALEAELEAVRGAPNGAGNDQLNRSAFALGRLVGAGLLGETAVVEALVDAATPRRPETEARATIQSGVDAGKREPRAPAPPPARCNTGAARPSQTPQIKITLDVRGVVDQALEALIAADVGVYQRAQSLVRVIQESGRPSKGIVRAQGTPIITTIGDSALLELLSDSADWIGFKKTKVGRIAEATHPPKWARDVLLARGTWPGLPWLEGVISSPTIRADGSILGSAGYDPASGLLFDPMGATFPAIPARPTREDARNALFEIAEPFAEFPFADQNVGLSGAIAAVLSIIARHAFGGPVPMFAIRSTTPGSGKDLMVCAICVIATGREPARTTAPRGKEADAEWRKRILAHALAGDSAILIGNVEGALGAPTLADTLTKTSITERLLGVNRNLTVPMFASWFATGNNLTFRGDLARRVIPVDLDPRVEHPEDRAGPAPDRRWTHPDLLDYVGHERPRLVSSALTLLRAFHVAGHPEHGKPLKGSFEAWDRLIRGAVIWAGAADPLVACQAVREEGDADLDALRGALACWCQAFGTETITAAHAVKEARIREDGELVTVLATLAGCEVMHLDGRALGNALRRVQGRIVGGLRFERAGGDRHEKVVRWHVRGEPGR